MMRPRARHEQADRALRGADGRGRRRITIGIDLGATAVRAAVLGDGHARGVHLAAVPLPVGAMSRGTVAEPAVVTTALRRLAAEAGLQRRRVVVGVSTPQVVVRSLTLPAMPPDKLRLALPFQAREVLPFPVADALLDFCPLPALGGDAARPRAGTVSGLLTAAPRPSVTGIAQAVERAGMSVARVDVASFGLLRSIGSAGAAVEALVDVGAELTTILIHRHGIPCVVRVVAFGGRQLTDELADMLGVGYAEAEATKCVVGVAGESAPALLLRAALRPLVSEIRTSLQYFVTSVGAAVERILLTGGTSRLPGLGPLLGGEFEQVVSAASTSELATSAVSVGLALGVAA